MGLAFDVIFFDLMNTVIRDPYREALVAATGLPLREAAIQRDPSVWPAFESGLIDEETFARTYFRPIGEDRTVDVEVREATATVPERRLDLAAVHRARHAGYAFIPGMRELLHALDGRAQRAIASNYPCWIDDIAERFELPTLFEHVFASCHLGVRKPSPEFYERILERVAKPAGACLFVDDREENCVAAERAGMRSHHFTTADSLRAALTRAALLPGR